MELEKGEETRQDLGFPALTAEQMEKRQHRRQKREREKREKASWIGRSIYR